MATDSKSHPYETTCVQAKATNQADHSDSSSQHNYRDVSSQDTGSQARLESQPGLSGNSYVDHELAGLDALEDGQPGERPSYPFTTLIRYAIKGSPKGRLLLEEIYQAIQSRYPFFATAPAGWKNSVRHTLSLMTCFEKIPRLLTEPGKGSYWTVNDTVPHAKPSRVRVRKRKTRADDGNDCPGTPMSTPDSFPPRAEDIGIFSDQVYHNGAPYGWSDGSSRRHSSYLQGDLNRQRVVYRTDQEAFWLDNDLQYHGSEGASTSKHRTRSQPVSERSPHDPRDLYSRYEHEGPVFEPKQAKTSSDGRSSPEETAPINATDYRIALMSELERLRNVIGRREDIDQEWCRLMVERLRGTGLSD